MGQYKVPQDVEAEDKLIGPLSLRQFIYVVIGVAWAGLMWLLFNKVIILMIVLILPITGFFLLLGFGRRQEQSFETYFVAMIKFLIEPHVRVWGKDLSQDELIKHVEKPVEIIPTKTLNRGSLKQLALIMDTHGTQKDPSIQLQDEANQAVGYGQRIITPQQVVGNGNAPMPTPAQPTINDDVLEQTNEHNQQVNQLLETVEEHIHTQALDDIKKGLTNPTQKSGSAKMISKPQTSSAILKRAVFQGNNLTVAQIAKETSPQNVLPEGQTINLSPGS
jgi:hypothetical protein